MQDWLLLQVKSDAATNATSWPEAAHTEYAVAGTPNLTEEVRCSMFQDKLQHVCEHGSNVKLQYRWNLAPGPLRVPCFATVLTSARNLKSKWQTCCALGYWNQVLKCTGGT